MKKYGTLTKAEAQVMNILWDMPDGGIIHEIIARYPDPKPAYTKGFVSHRKVSGKTYIFFPLVSKQEYTNQVIDNVKWSFFGGSGSSFLKFFVENEKMSQSEIKELIEIIQNSNPQE